MRTMITYLSVRQCSGIQTTTDIQNLTDISNTSVYKIWQIGVKICEQTWLLLFQGFGDPFLHLIMHIFHAKQHNFIKFTVFVFFCFVFLIIFGNWKRQNCVLGHLFFVNLFEYITWQSACVHKQKKNQLNESYKITL